MATEVHRWAVALPVEVIVQKNEDGQFAARLPDGIQIRSEGEMFPFPLEDVLCMNCGKCVVDTFATACEPME